MAMLAVLLLASAAVQSADRIELTSERNFEETVQQLQWAFGGYGLTIVTALDSQQILKKLKVDIGRAVTFEVMRRDWLKTLVSRDPAMGFVLPVRIYVFEDTNATTKVTYPSSRALLETHSDEIVRALGIELDMKLHALLTQATKRRLEDQ